MTYTTTSYGEVTNSPDIYDAITEDLCRDGTVILGWNDGAGSLIDVLLVLNAPRVGPPANIDGRTEKLFVSALKFGSFAFGAGGYLEPGYFAQKLGVTPNPTWVALAELVTEVRTRLANQGRLS